MKITGITTRIVRESSELWHAPAPTPEGYCPFFDFPLTILQTDEGIDGYTMDYCPLGQGRGSAYALHDIYYHDLIGKDPMDHELIWQQLRSKQRHLYNFRETIWSNLDVALWDIKGKKLQLPVVKMLGQVRDKVPCYATCPPQAITTVEQIAEQVTEKLKRGFQGIKLQLSGGSALDVPRLQKAREVAGRNYPLMVDSSAMLTFEDALKIGYELDNLHYEWFEEPFPDAHIIQLKKLSHAIKTPVLAAETVGLFELPHYMANGAIDIIRGDVHNKSGITGVMKAIAMCEMMGYELEIHTASAPLLDIANLHVACATRLSRFCESHHPLFRFGIKDNPLEIDKDGFQHCPSKPGLGVEIDWDWIDDHTVEVIEGKTW